MSGVESELLLAKLRRFFQYHRCEPAEDLAQETVLRALQHQERGQVIYAQNPHSYYLGIARNIVREERKKYKPDPQPELEPPDRHDAVSQVHGRILLRECLTSLDPADRDIITGYILDGPEETARRLGLSANALRVRVSRIRARIDSLLGRDGEK